MAWNPTAQPSSPSTDPDEAPIRLEIDGAVATITVNRPTKGNSLNLRLFTELNAAVSRLHTDETVRAVIVTGTGTRAFSAGADITELDGLAGPAAYEYSAAGQYVYDQLENLPKPVIAAINGVAFGGGLELALACDIRIAADTARLGQPEITLANIPGWGATQRLPRTIGVGRAKAMLLTGAPVTAATALEYGLVTEVVPAEALVERARQLAQDLATRAPLAVGGIKQAVAAGIAGGNEAGMRTERLGVATCSGSDDQLAAVQAFLNRRKQPQQV